MLSQLLYNNQQQETHHTEKINMQSSPTPKTQQTEQTKETHTTHLKQGDSKFIGIHPPQQIYNNIPMASKTHQQQQQKQLENINKQI